MKLCLAALLCLIFDGPALAAATAGGTPPGLYVQNGRLLRLGQPYSGIGANYDTLFGRLLQDKDDTASLQNLDRLAAKGIPFVRFRAGGFWPKNWQLYLSDRDEYFRRLDLVVSRAERDHIGLIPSLFWKLVSISDLVGEAPRETGNPKSKTIAFIKQYTREVVQRYRNSPAIWGWEFGNEANLGVDMTPQGDNPLPRLTTNQLAVAYASFGATVRSLDPSRVITSGTTIPRPAAWHNAHGQPRQRDSAAQAYAILRAQNPDPINLLSVHIYQKSQKLSPYGPETVGQFIERYTRAAAAAGKPFVSGRIPGARPGANAGISPLDHREPGFSVSFLGFR